MLAIPQYGHSTKLAHILSIIFLSQNVHLDPSILAQKKAVEEKLLIYLFKIIFQSRKLLFLLHLPKVYSGSECPTENTHFFQVFFVQTA